MCGENDIHEYEWYVAIGEVVSATGRVIATGCYNFDQMKDAVLVHVPLNTPAENIHVYTRQ